MPTRNPSSTTKRSSHPSRTTQPLINSFGRISKAQLPVTSKESVSRLEIASKTQRNNTAPCQQEHSSKRKREGSEDALDEADQRRAKPFKKAKADDEGTTDVPECVTPKKPRSNPQNFPTPDSTPTKPTSPHALQTTPTKGRQRLLDIKDLVANAQKTHAAIEAPNIPDSPSNRKAKALQSRSISLYDRLRAKVAEKANAPPPLSAEETARRNALQRLPDVVRVIAMPPAKKTLARGSYSLKALTQRVQHSARSPMGAEEIERCLRLLAEEAKALDAVGFVRLSKTGTIDIVTVDARCRPQDLEKKVAKMTANVGC